MLTPWYDVPKQTLDRGQDVFGQRVTASLAHAKGGNHGWVRQIPEPEREVATPYRVFGELTTRLPHSFAAATFAELWKARSGPAARRRGVLPDVCAGRRVCSSSDDEKPLTRSTAKIPLEPRTKAVGLQQEAAHSEPALIGLNADRAGQRVGA